MSKFNRWKVYPLIVLILIWRKLKPRSKGEK